MTESAAIKRIRQELKDNHVVLFMKGTPSQPRCGFSAEAVSRLKEGGIACKCVNVMEDQSLFDGIRQYTNYTHFPQMFVDGRFVGSSESIRKMASKKHL